MAPRNGNPRLCFLPGLPIGPGILVGRSGSEVVVELLVSVLGLLTKSNIEVCLLAFLMGIGMLPCVSAVGALTGALG